MSKMSKKKAKDNYRKTNEQVKALAEDVVNRTDVRAMEEHNLTTHRNPDAHRILVEEICKELHDFYMILDHCSRTYDYFSEGRISKPNTYPEEVFAVAQDLEAERFEEWKQDEMGLASKPLPCGHDNRSLCGPECLIDNVGVTCGCGKTPVHSSADKSFHPR